MTLRRAVKRTGACDQCKMATRQHNVRALTPIAGRRSTDLSRHVFGSFSGQIRATTADAVSTATGARDGCTGSARRCAGPANGAHPTGEHASPAGWGRRRSCRIDPVECRPGLPGCRAPRGTESTQGGEREERARSITFVRLRGVRTALIRTQIRNNSDRFYHSRAIEIKKN